MKFATRRALEAAAPAPGTALGTRARLLIALVPAMLALGLSGQVAGTAAASEGMARDLRVGHTVKRIVVSGSALCPDARDPDCPEKRQVDVHLWYPADPRGFADAPKAVYTSTLNGRSLGALGDPLSWSISAEIAREDVAIDPNGKAFPVVVFSHGSTNEPIAYAHTLELIAGKGFVVAAPAHVNNSQDDVMRDFINDQARLRGQPRLFNCNDGLPPRTLPVPGGDCSKANVPFNMADRVRDISKVLDGVPGWLGDRADVSRAGVLGHSRGTATALAAAGGSAARSGEAMCQASGALCWPLAPEPRVKAVMGMAIAVPRITFGADVAGVDVPTLLVAGGRDLTSPPQVSKDAYDMISSEEKAFVSIKNATHRTFDSTFCAQLQASGAIAQRNPQAILDLHTARSILRDPRGTSGVGTDYCSFDSFTNPFDIRPLVASITGINVTPQNVPATGLETEEVKYGMTELAAAFFGTVLKRVGNDGIHFTRYLAPKWLEKHEPMVDQAEAVAGADAICPPGQEVVCED